MNLSFGEVFQIFIKDLKVLNLELLKKVENYEIYKNLKLSYNSKKEYLSKYLSWKSILNIIF